MSRLVTAAVFAALLCPTALAAEPDTGQTNACELASGVIPCASDTDCADKTYAKSCVQFGGAGGSSFCAVTCGSAGATLPSACGGGEACVAVGGGDYACMPVQFRMDIALLDQCISHFVEESKPVLSDTACSLEANLNRLLDQDGDSDFDVYDVDLCVLAFLEQPHCRPDEAGELPSGCCDHQSANDCRPGDRLACDPDAIPVTRDDGAAVSVCGFGLHCDEDRRLCTRECGTVASREVGIGSLNRECPGALKACDQSAGECVPIDPTLKTCQADSECPSGAYCLLGRCAPNCYRAADCPGGGWYCSMTNKCRALPPPAGDGGFVFDPDNYVVRFARDSLALDDVQLSDSATLAIMDRLTGRQVIGNPAVGFGYRMEIEYGPKLDTRCLRPFTACEDGGDTSTESEAECVARRSDCLIDGETESWIRPVSPFGNVNAAFEPSLGVELDEAIAAELSPGIWPATVTLIFDNGDRDSISVRYTKASLSGEYNGSLTVYFEVVEQPLNADRPLTFGMKLSVDDSTTRQWTELMESQNLGVDDEGLTDTTEGFVVRGLLHGSSAMSFTRGGALGTATDEVPFIGLYTPSTHRVRLVGVIDIPGNFCIDEAGNDCAGADDDDGSDSLTQSVRVRNVFQRDIRRRIELFGVFDSASARLHGLYRETISGLSPAGDFTLSGGFILDQTLADGSPLTFDDAFLPDGAVDPDGGVGTLMPADVEEVSFQDVDARSRVAAEIATWCDPIVDAGDDEAAVIEVMQDGVEAFRSAYLEQAVRGETTVFGDLVSFRSLIEVALSAMGADSAASAEQNHLNVYDFLKNWIVPCDDDATMKPPGCIDEAKLRCGLALHQYAILHGWILMDQVEGGETPIEAEQDLFCLATLPTTGCPETAKDYPDLFAMQEHNRFWRDLAQARKFQGDRARSDAFLALFRNEVNPFVQGTALAYKADKLREAVDSYDAAVQLIAAPGPAAVLFNWPAGAFKQSGGDWLAMMATILDDRMGAVVELVDLKRRVFENSGDGDFIFAHHMVQQEYLLQVYLMALQIQWQGPSFDYENLAATILERGRNVLATLDPSRNALGLVSSRVFFENSDPDSTNWENYRNILAEQLAGAEEEVETAIEEMQGALEDVDALEEALYEYKRDLDGALVELCGAANPLVPSVCDTATQQFKSQAIRDKACKGKTDTECDAIEAEYCADVDPKSHADYCQQLMLQYHDYESWAAARDCKLKGGGADCPDGFTLTCDDFNDKDILSGGNALDESEDCKDVVSTFQASTDDINTGVDDPVNHMPVCAMDTEEVWIVDVDGNARPCVAGESGALLQDRASLANERRIVIGSVDTLIRTMLATLAHAKQVTSQLDGYKSLVVSLTAAIDAMGLAVDIGQGVLDTVEAVTAGPDCVLIAGLATGTDCPGSVARSVADGVAVGVWSAIQVGIASAQSALGIKIEEAGLDLDKQMFLLDLALELSNMEREIDGLIDEYNVLTQEYFNLGVAIENNTYQAQQLVDTYKADVTFVAEHLVGRESGNLLAGEAAARGASEAFADLVRTAYKMTMAFIHQYNPTASEATVLVNTLMGAVTLDDIQGHIDLLDLKAEQYCGKDGFDCDAFTNVEVLRYSVREQLFGHLADKIDANGQTVTAGEQFHNIITATPYLKRRIRGVLPVDQIELQIPLPLSVQTNAGTGAASWLIDPLSCNHVLDARDPLAPTDHAGDGNVAVNVVGKNLDGAGQAVRYEIARGPSDYIRACGVESVQQEIGTLPVLDYPIRNYVVGYAPQHAANDAPSPPSYTSRSASLNACINAEETNASLDGAPCWSFFARDRSLASLDQKIMIPMSIDGAGTDNSWLGGAGLSDDERPIIEDIVVYFRYRTRPIAE